MDDIHTMIAVTTKKSRKFMKVSASADWLSNMKITNPDQGRAVISERAYKLLELQRLAGTEKIEATSFHFTTRRIPGSISLIPGMEPLGATSNYCCICNDASPPECACVPC